MTQLIEAEELLDNLSAWRLFDCRAHLQTPEAARQAYLQGHIPGARHADLERDLSAVRDDGQGGRHPLPDRSIFMDWLGRQGLSGDEAVLVYDDFGGAFAARLWWMLCWVGHRGPLALLNGGLPAWQAVDGPIQAGEPAVTACVYQAGESRVRTLDRATVWQEVQGEQARLLLDARDPLRYRGEQEPFADVAGHIPGAWNFPFAWHWDVQRRVSSLQQVAQRLDQLPAERPLGLYCGSGVTACFHALMFDLLGRDIPPVYIGSWSDWAISGLPVETGSVTQADWQPEIGKTS